MGKQKEEEEKKDRKAILLEERKKAIYNLVLLFAAAFVVLIGVLTMAWFVNNTKVNGSNMSVTVDDKKFTITMFSESRDGIFKQVYHEAVHEKNALYWQMTATNNLVNYIYPTYNEDNEIVNPGDRGIHPGTEGVISFNVIPKVSSLDLIFDFEIIGYQASYIDANETPDNHEDDELVMTKLSDVEDGSGDIPRNLLNGHILLFENRTETTENGVTTITYSKPILSNQQMHRIMYKPISGKDTATPINIYWVWPNTLSTIVDARSFNGITAVPFCEDDDAYGCDSYTAVIENLESNPQYFLKGVNANDTITAADIADNYDYYGDMYDQGDNEIGMRVNYLLIKLSVIEGTAGGGS